MIQESLRAEVYRKMNQTVVGEVVVSPPLEADVLFDVADGVGEESIGSAGELAGVG